MSPAARGARSTSPFRAYSAEYGCLCEGVIHLGTAAHSYEGRACKFNFSPMNDQIYVVDYFSSLLLCGIR